MHNARSTLHKKKKNTARCTLHQKNTAHCTLHDARRSKMQFDFKTLHDAHCTTHDAHCTLHEGLKFNSISNHCTLHIAHCTMHEVRCTLHAARSTLKSTATHTMTYFTLIWVSFSFFRVEAILRPVHFSVNYTVIYYFHVGIFFSKGSITKSFSHLAS